MHLNKKIESKDIAKRLKEARKARGFKAARTFSKLHQIAESTYAQHESGKRKLNITTLLEYSDLMQINGAWLLTGQGAMFASPEDSSALKLGNITADLPKLSMLLQIVIPYIEDSKITDDNALTEIIYKMYREIEINDLDVEELPELAASYLAKAKILAPV